MVWTQSTVMGSYGDGKGFVWLLALASEAGSSWLEVQINGWKWQRVITTYVGQ